MEEEKEIKEVQNENKEPEAFTADKDEAFLKKVEKAAAKGAAKGGKRNGLLFGLIVVATVALLAAIFWPRVSKSFNIIDRLFAVEEDVEGKDLTLNNYGIFGYKAVDFEEAILGDTSRLKKVEVYSQEISDIATVTKAGLADLKIFSKTQLITYKGYAVYTVDLSKLSSQDVSFDDRKCVVTLAIPRPQLEQINIPESDIQFGEVNKGALAFGSLAITPEELMQIQANVRLVMEDKLLQENAQATAERFAILSIWEMYNPLIKLVGKNVSLEVVFKD